MCWGSCCPLVNTALNTLVQVGELNDDAEVSLFVLSWCIICVIIEYSCCVSGIHFEAGKPEDSSQSSGKTGMCWSV